LPKIKLTLGIEIDTKNLVRQGEGAVSFLIGYINNMKGHKVLSSQYEEVKE
tara:strand:- start:5172 stop:5324 length:153 start_codon:yes stop_codon:yes gene_type:complete